MKILFTINRVVLIITITLYLTFILGLYAQIILGIVQVLSSFILITVWKDLQKSTKANAIFLLDFSCPLWIMLVDRLELFRKRNVLLFRTCYSADGHCGLLHNTSQ